MLQYPSIGGVYMTIYDVILYVLFRTLCILFLLLRCSELWILVHVAACQASFAHKATMEAARSLRIFLWDLSGLSLKDLKDSPTLMTRHIWSLSKTMQRVKLWYGSLDTLEILSEVARAQGQLQEEACRDHVWQNLKVSLYLSWISSEIWILKT